MKSELIHNFLLSKNYKYEPRGPGDADYVVGNYYRVPYDVKDLPLCLCNDKPPQIHVQESYFGVNSSEFHNFTIGLRNEAPQGWINFEFYNLSEPELIERFDPIVEALFSAWRTLSAPPAN